MGVRLLLAVLTSIAIPAAAECVARSGPQTAALVELYTSEGCSSCPPADRWLSRFTPTADGRVVPVAFHVNYWDYIGWRDVFADPRYTERQRDRARASGARSVYTPQVVVGGRDFPGWRGVAAQQAIDAINATPAAADLELRIAAPADGVIAVNAAAKIRPRAAPGRHTLVVAVTQNGLSSRVTAGENRGEHLAHDFVVRDLAATGGAAVAARFTPKADWDLARMSVVAFVQDTATGQVLQALRAALCR